MKAVVSTDGRYVATVGGEQIRIWEVNSSSLYMQFSTGGEINCLGWKPVKLPNSSHRRRGINGSDCGICVGSY